MFSFHISMRVVICGTSLDATGALYFAKGSSSTKNVYRGRMSGNTCNFSTAGMAQTCMRISPGNHLQNLLCNISTADVVGAFGQLFLDGGQPLKSRRILTLP